MFCGTLLVAKGGLVSSLIGIFICGIGILLYTSSKNAYHALNQLKNEHISDQVIKESFHKFDHDNTGELSSPQLAQLCQALGSPLNYNDLESAILLLDKNGDGKIDYKEFLTWWKGDEEV